jgi:iron(III) transport system substrate-binding protein
MSHSAFSRHLAVATIGLLALTGCTTTPDAEPAPAPEPAVEEGSAEAIEGTLESDGFLIVYSGRNEELVQPLIDQFSQETGIEVEVRYGGTGEMAATLLEEGDATNAGVFLSQDAGALGALSKAGLFVTLPEDISGAVAQGFTSTDGSWVGVTGRARVIVYDSETLDEAEVPTTSDGIVLPEWSGQVGIAPTNASFQSAVTAYRVLRGDGATESWLAALKTNDAQIFDSNGAILEAVESGQIAMGLINHYYWYRMVSERGEENVTSRLLSPEAGDPASIVNVTGVGILAPAQLDQDAYDFVRYLISETGQQYFVAQTFEYPLVAGIAAPEGLPDLETLINPELDLSDLDDLRTTQEMLQRVGLP